MKLIINLIFVSFLSIFDFVITYDILSKNIFIEIDAVANQGKVTETIEYNFPENSFVKIEKSLPSVSGNISNITVTSVTQNIDKYDIDNDDSSNSKLIRIYINKTIVNKIISIEIIYFINEILSDNKTFFAISNLDNDNDINAKIELKIKQLYNALTPEKVILNNSNENDQNKRVNIRSETNISISKYHVVPQRKRIMKYDKEKIHYNNDIKISFNLLLAKNKLKNLVFEFVGNDLHITDGNFNINFEKGRNYDELYNDNYFLKNQHSSIPKTIKEMIETIIGIFIIGIIIVICYYKTNSSENK